MAADCAEVREEAFMREGWGRPSEWQGEGRGRTHPAVHQESWIPAVCLPQMRGNLEHKRDQLNIPHQGPTWSSHSQGTQGLKTLNKRVKNNAKHGMLTHTTSKPKWKDCLSACLSSICLHASCLYPWRTEGLFVFKLKNVFLQSPCSSKHNGSNPSPSLDIGMHGRATSLVYTYLWMKTSGHLFSCWAFLSWSLTKP